MPDPSVHRAGLVCVPALLACLAIAVAGYAQSADERYLRFTVSADALKADGMVAAEHHVRRLADTAALWAPGRTFVADLQAIPGTPTDWWLTAELALRTAALLEQGTVALADEGIEIEGVTTDAEAFDAILRRLDAVRRDSMPIDSRVVVVGPADTPFSVACRRQFFALTRDNRVAFVNAGAELRSGAQPLLDRLTELMVDCPDLGVEIIGHTDDRGDARVNEALSLARAESVVDYLRAQGIPASRLAAAGAGSSEPLASNAELSGRRLNRRVEFRVANP